MAISGALYGWTQSINMRGVAKTPTGQLYVIGTTTSAANPAGTLYKNGLAFHPDGYLYVVFA